MEGNNENNIKVELQKEDLGQPNVPLKKCNRCGKMLPLDHFAKYGHGYSATCEVCRRAASGVSERLKSLLLVNLLKNLNLEDIRASLLE